MKLKFVIDDSYDETILNVYASSYNEEVRIIEEFFSQTFSSRILGFDEDMAFVIEPKEIYRFFTEEKSTFVETKKGILKVRYRIYELEDKFKDLNFLKISRGEIVNLSYVKRLDFTFKGTIALELKNGSITYVSRRNLGDFKKALGI